MCTRLSTGFPRACSGDIYAAVPMITLICVATAVRVGGETRLHRSAAHDDIPSHWCGGKVRLSVGYAFVLHPAPMAPLGHSLLTTEQNVGRGSQPEACVAGGHGRDDAMRTRGCLRSFRQSRSSIWPRNRRGGASHKTSSPALIREQPLARSRNPLCRTIKRLARLRRARMLRADDARSRAVSR